MIGSTESDIARCGIRRQVSTESQSESPCFDKSVTFCESIKRSAAANDAAGSRKRRRVSFAEDETAVRSFEKNYDAEEVWWTDDDLNTIKRREGTFVRGLCRDAASRPCRKTLQDAWKKCLEIPSLSPELENASAVPRGLERYVAPLLTAHRDMVSKSLLSTQEELRSTSSDPIARMNALSVKYQHLNKISTNFAISMALRDAQDAAEPNL